MPDITDLLRPLSSCPAGSHVVYEDEVCQVVLPSTSDYSPAPVLTRRGASLTTNWAVPHDTRVLLLEGDEPVGPGQVWLRHVWDQATKRVMRADEGRFMPASDRYWPIVAPDPAPAESSCWVADEWPEGARGRWSVWRKGSSDEALLWTDDEADARALADHLNSTQWEPPPPPEPERPTPAQALDAAFRPMVVAGWPEMGEFALDALTDHGYRVVDVGALGDAIEWLRRLARTDPPQAGHRHDPSRALLDALGQ